MRNRKIIAVSLSVALILTAFTGCGSKDQNEEVSTEATKPTVFRLASDAPLRHLASELNQEACEKIEEKTEGRVIIQYYPESQLGSYETVYEEIVMGIIDIGQITVPDFLDPRLGSAYLPYYATSFEEAQILYAPDSYISQVFSELTAKNEVRFLGWVLEGFIGIGVVEEPQNVRVPGAEKEIKLRSPAMTTFRYALEDLGYEPVTITYAEVPTAIRTNVVDGWVGGTPNMNYAWVGDIISTMYINYLSTEATCYVMSEKSLAKLSEEDRQTMIEVFQEQSIKSFQDSRENEEIYKKKLNEDYGVEVIELSKEEIAANAEYVRDITWTRLEEVLTPELIAGFREEVGKLKQ